ncbi:MAG: carbonic anhydrase [Promethearchaeota archaeon]
MSDITFCDDEILEDEIINLLLTRNQKWMNVKDGSNTVNCSLSAVVLSCIDSRVPVEKIFQAKPGELLVLKNAGNIVTMDMLRSILVAIFELKARFIIILGHTQCGMAIKDNFEKISHLETLLSPKLIKVIQNSKSAEFIEWFGFFEEGKWIENAKVQANVIEEYLDDLVPKANHPSVLVALYDLDSGEVKFID